VLLFRESPPGTLASLVPLESSAGFPCRLGSSCVKLRGDATAKYAVRLLLTDFRTAGVVKWSVNSECRAASADCLNLLLGIAARGGCV
jgi:hypothetical protein